MIDIRITELLQQAAEDGFTLALPPEEIVAHEDRGAIVDLVTGEVVYGVRPVADMPLPDALALLRAAKPALARAGG